MMLIFPTQVAVDTLPVDSLSRISGELLNNRVVFFAGARPISSSDFMPKAHMPMDTISTPGAIMSCMISGLGHNGAECGCSCTNSLSAAICIW